MPPPLVRGRRRVLQQLFGLVFIAGLVGVVVLTAAIYQKAFTPVVTVSLEAGRIGNQLQTGADVKARGLLVGEIREVRTTGDGAVVEMALQPEAAARIPSDTRARLLPKTLFGEKFVALEFEDDSTAEPLAEGDVIPQDRSASARETEQALNDLLPLLQALKPQQLSLTLNAVSSALRGRGDQLGENLELVETYLKEFNPEIPTFGEDLAGTADLADTLVRAAPDVLALLDELSEVNRDLVDQEQELSTFLAETTGFAEETEQFTLENEQRFITLAAEGLPSLRVFEKYSPGFRCLFDGLVAQNQLAEDTLGGLQPGLHITLEFTSEQGEYRPGDEPLYGETSGPTCRGLPPNPPEVPFPIEIEVTDGYCDEQEEAPGVQTECQREPAGPGPAAAPDSAADDPARALSRTAVERAAVGAVVGPVLGTAPDEVPDLALLLFGPMARGTTVGLGR
jgi:phospholipid/cholesterol/gamma-HCH transport system substrate-binding protein